MARHSATARLATAAHLLTWLAGRGLDLAGCRQPDLDAYLAKHPTRRNSLHGFLAWTYRTRRSHKLTITSGPKPLPRTVAADDEQRWAIVRALLHDDGHTPADRVAGLLVLLFGQRPHRISRLTVDDVGVGGRVTITLGLSPIQLPDPLAGELPPAILGDLLGLGRTAVQDWSTLAARPWASYVADRLDGASDANESKAAAT